MGEHGRAWESMGEHGRDRTCQPKWARRSGSSSRCRRPQRNFARPSPPWRKPPKSVWVWQPCFRRGTRPARLARGCPLLGSSRWAAASQPRSHRVPRPRSRRRAGGHRRGRWRRRRAARCRAARSATGAGSRRRRLSPKVAPLEVAPSKLRLARWRRALPPLPPGRHRRVRTPSRPLAKRRMEERRRRPRRQLPKTTRARRLAAQFGSLFGRARVRGFGSLCRWTSPSRSHPPSEPGARSSR